MYQSLNMQTKIITFLEEDIRGKFSRFGVRKDFLLRLPKNINHKKEDDLKIYK